MIAEIIALLTAVNVAAMMIVLTIGFLIVITGIILVKYFKFIFGYLTLFGFLVMIVYAGWHFWPKV